MPSINATSSRKSTSNFSNNFFLIVDFLIVCFASCLCLLIIFDASCSALSLFSFFMDWDISIRSSVVPLIAEQTITISLCLDNELM